MGLVATSTIGADNDFVVDTKKVGAEIQPTMYGIFFEDINFAADGGLYAEMVKNRSFEFPQHLMGWTAFGKFEVRNDGPFERNPHYVRLSDPGHRHYHCYQRSKTALYKESFNSTAAGKGGVNRNKKK